MLSKTLSHEVCSATCTRTTIKLGERARQMVEEKGRRRRTTASMLSGSADPWRRVSPPDRAPAKMLIGRGGVHPGCPPHPTMHRGCGNALF